MNRRPIKGAALGLVALIPHIRSVAHAHGYALAIHGSLTFDLDLIAIPWTDDAMPLRFLIEDICEAIGGHESPKFPNPVAKPHGRIAYSWYLTAEDAATGSGPYVDISIMPRKRQRRVA